ncbi:conserved hypothetical protein [Theileria orientalis strain Shintoku]|uniref:Uncharacterized protein n=1 Tax=Theileria orientalis strain Shintoku TaxID=869250 RepID=J7MGW1_THEOR|nr:conserved hypothetical protein [Theileria orientalis strain Shintoku]BAM42331.1 conserved hypothetical protein [Theileria orientalis strain Shintoku]|eukprot:XP_009692632.1 conserved hypothetical protein [Theileria orientalis strain Shintoku]
MLKWICSKLGENDRDVPLLRGKIHYLVVIYFSTLLKNAKDDNIPVETRYALLIFMMCITISMVGCSLLHGNQTYKYRSAYRRIDIAGIFLIVSGKMFPMYVHYMNKDRVMAVMASLQWLMTLSGVFGSLVFDYSSVTREVRSVVFFLTSSPNMYLFYRMYRCGQYLALFCLVLVYWLIASGAIIYCKEKLRLLKGVFEFH